MHDRGLLIAEFLEDTAGKTAAASLADAEFPLVTIPPSTSSSLHSPVLIIARVPLKGNEDLRTAERSERFKVNGTIKEINEMESLVLKDCSLEKTTSAD